MKPFILPVLMGIKHCGKTTLGKALAKNLGLRFTDTDQEVEALYEAETGLKRSFREIYSDRGPYDFRRLEAEALRDAAERVLRTREAEVIALGGGTIENTTALSHIAGLSVFIYLEEAETTLFERIVKSGIPPFLSGGDPRSAFHALYVKRTPLYRRRADIVVNLHSLDSDEALERIMRDLRRFHERE